MYFTTCAFFLHTRAADISPAHIDVSGEKVQQQTCLVEFIRDLHEEPRTSITNNVQGSDACTWQGLRCENEVIYKVYFHGFFYGNVRIGFLPHIVRLMNLSWTDQNYPFQTRLLPRGAKKVNLSANRLTGTPDFTQLPPRINVLNLCYNELVGPINLTRLPRYMKRLDVNDNRIKQEVVFYDNPPDTSCEVLLTGLMSTNSISAVEAVDPNAELKPTLAFPGMTSGWFMF